MIALTRTCTILAALPLALVASPVAAQPAATARLVSCGTGNCLLVQGHRSSPLATVSINDRPVEARGRRSWRITLPMDTVRSLSAPFARTLRVAVSGPSGIGERSQSVRLPVGLLGRSIELASLVVFAR